MREDLSQTMGLQKSPVCDGPTQRCHFCQKSLTIESSSWCRIDHITRPQEICVPVLETDSALLTFCKLFLTSHNVSEVGFIYSWKQSLCNDTLIQSIKNSTEIHCYLHQQYFAALAQYHMFSSHHICLKIKLHHSFSSSLWVSFLTVNFLLFFFLFLLYSEPADNSVFCSNTCNGSTWRTQELSIQTVPLQDADVYLVCRFATCLHFLAEIFQDLESKHQKCLI